MSSSSTLVIFHPINYHYVSLHHGSAEWWLFSRELQIFPKINYHPEESGYLFFIHRQAGWIIMRDKSIKAEGTHCCACYLLSISFHILRSNEYLIANVGIIIRFIWSTQRVARELADYSLLFAIRSFTEFRFISIPINSFPQQSGWRSWWSLL